MNGSGENKIVYCSNEKLLHSGFIAAVHNQKKECTDDENIMSCRPKQ